MAATWAASGGSFTSVKHSMTYDFISPLKLDLTGKRVLVTGGAWETGVGYATATAFARAGASAIVVADIHDVPDELVAKLKTMAKESGRPEPKVLGCAVDIAKLDSVQDLYATVSEAFGGRLDVLVNNAAHMEPYKPMLESDPDVYWRTYEVNIHGLFNMVRTFLPTLLSTRSEIQGLGTLINVSSSGALTARPGSASYRSSKLAVLRWTETLQMEYGEQGLLAFCVNPGSIKTEITRGVPEKARAGLRDSPEMPGDTIAWLVAERREWLAGRYVSCAWDMKEVMQKRDDIVEHDKLKMRMVF